ncbi:MAG: PQQ-binding-like beta-propeller repeat protein, partial [Geobacteraceae bacterium]
IKTGQEKWRFKAKNGNFGPAIDNGVVYSTGLGSSLYAVDIKTGQEKWRFKTETLSWPSKPAVFNGVVYFGSGTLSKEGGFSTDGNLYAVDAKTGQEKWRFKTGAILSPPTIADGVVYIGSIDNNLYAVDIESGQEKWRFKTEGNIMCSSAISDGVVYFGNEDHNLYAIADHIDGPLHIHAGSKKGNGENAQASTKTSSLVTVTDRVIRTGGSDDSMPEADEWAGNYANSKYVSDATILGKIPAVRLSMLPNSQALQWIGQEEMASIVSAAVLKEGLKITTDSRYELIVRIMTNHQSIEQYIPAAGGMNYHKVHQIFVSVNFVTRVPVLRQGRFDMMPVILAGNWGKSGGPGNFTKEYLRGEIKDLISSMFSDLRENSISEDSEHERQWKRSLWPAAKNSTMYFSYRNATETDKSVTPKVLVGGETVKPVDVKFYFDAGKYLTISQVKNILEAQLQNSGIRIGPESDISLLYEVGIYIDDSNMMARTLGWGIKAAPYADDFGIIRIWQDNVVFNLNGEFVRAKVGLELENILPVMAPLELNHYALKTLIATQTDSFVHRLLKSR